MKAEDIINQLASMRSCAHTFNEACIYCFAREAIALLRRSHKALNDADALFNLCYQDTKLYKDVVELLEGQRPPENELPDKDLQGWDDNGGR